MFKKLSGKTQNQILETGIRVFAAHGLDRANMCEVAKAAGVSVGVIYKYYQDKDTFFLACVRHSLELLRQVLEEAAISGTDIEDCIRKVIRALIENAKTHADYNVMYNEITSGGAKRFAAQLAVEIESVSADVYTNVIENAKNNGRVKSKFDSKLFAFFFDNLLMMLQYSYCCDYYKERMRIYCGEQVFDQDELVLEELMKFINGALGIEQK